MQRSIFRFHFGVVLVFFCAIQTHAQSVDKKFQDADSLFSARQYIASFELYQQLLDDHYYSPVMFLKMSFIQEGLQHVGRTLYFLNLYYLTSSDPQAFEKMEEIAIKNELEGYTPDDARRMLIVLQDNYNQISLAIGAILVFFLALIYVQKIRLKQKPYFASFSFLFFAMLLFAHANFSRQNFGIIASSSTYLMSGPSSGANVVSIINEGHQLRITGKEDVWVKVKWQDEDAYVRQNFILPIQL